MLDALLRYLLHRHDFVHEEPEPFIKCECGVTIPFERLESS